MTVNNDSRNLLTILGPTASGKTALAVSLARKFDGEIISADSRQVFRGMDIGSGKDLHEYGEIPYHLIDILDAGEEFSLFGFLKHFGATHLDISTRNKLPVLCGGSGLYLDAVLRGYNMVEVPVNNELRRQLSEKSDDELTELLCKMKPFQHNKTDMLDRERTIRAIEICNGEQSGSGSVMEAGSFNNLVLGIKRDRQTVRHRITARLKERLANGMVDEVEQIHSGGVTWDMLDYYGLEYRYVGAYLRGDINRNDMFQKLNSAIHDFAKRQENWFRKMERNGIVINWLDGDNDIVGLAIDAVEKWQSRSI